MAITCETHLPEGPSQYNDTVWPTQVFATRADTRVTIGNEPVFISATDKMIRQQFPLINGESFSMPVSGMHVEQWVGRNKINSQGLAEPRSIHHEHITLASMVDKRSAGILSAALRQESTNGIPRSISIHLPRVFIKRDLIVCRPNAYEALMIFPGADIAPVIRLSNPDSEPRIVNIDPQSMSQEALTHWNFEYDTDSIYVVITDMLGYQTEDDQLLTPTTTFTIHYPTFPHAMQEIQQLVSGGNYKEENLRKIVDAHTIWAIDDYDEY